MTSRATQEYLGPKRRKNPARWGCTHLYRLYKGVPPGGFIRPRRHMDSQSCRENRRDERFQVTPFHPACLTASLKTFYAPSLPTRLTAPVKGIGFSFGHIHTNENILFTKVKCLLRNASFRASHQQRKWSVGVLHELLLYVYDISLKIVT